MVKCIRLFQDMTFQEKTVITSQDKIKFRGEKDYTPRFTMGTSVFRERPFPFLKRLLIFWKKPRNLMLLLDGTPEAVTLDLDHLIKNDKTGTMEEHPALNFKFGDMKDTKDFIYKIVAKSKAEQKPMSTTMFTILAILIGIVVVFQFMLMKGVHF